jgi:hypothetical protein
MKGKTKRYDMRRGTATAAKREIAGNTYIVTVYPVRDGEQRVIVYADKTHGDDHGFFKSITGRMDKPYGQIVRTKIDPNKEQAPQLAKIVNEAVNALSGHLENTSSTEDAVLGALEANADARESEE